MIQTNTLIVGGGMAGLGSAHTLLKHDNTNFLLVSDLLGGRVLTSSDGQTNYGAFVVSQSEEQGIDGAIFHSVPEENLDNHYRVIR